MTIEAVLAGEKTCHIEACSAAVFLAKIPRKAVRLVFSSPPYALKMHRYGKRDKGGVQEWIDLMFRCTVRATAATAGPVMWVVNSPFDEGIYHPAVEGLMWQWYEAAGDMDRPVIWHKNAAPCRQGKWFTNDWESILCFGTPVEREVWNWEAIATPPKYKAGGAFRQRGSDGVRRKGSDYPTNKLTNPRDVLRVVVGGGMMGYDKSDEQFIKESNAPYPVKLVEPFIKALTNPGDVVCDPFSGSGTTARVCLELGRRFIGCDLDEEQVEISVMRLQAAVLNKSEQPLGTCPRCKLKVPITKADGSLARTCKPHKDFKKMCEGTGAICLEDQSGGTGTCNDVSRPVPKST